jgi:Flp pilus assembly protein TadG
MPNNRRARSGGNALVELSLCSTVLLSLFLGVSQFGYSFYNYNQLEHAVRAGARYASLRAYNSASATPTGDYTTAVQNVVLYGSPNPATGATPSVANLASSNVTLTVTFTTVPTQVTVAINNYNLTTFFGRIPLNGKPTTTFPYVGTFGPP